MERDAGAPHLGELELAVMTVIWARGAATVREVLEGLDRSPSPGYTTVATIMTRLLDKGLLRRARAGKVDTYSPRYDRAEFDRRSATAAVRGLVAEYGDLALAQFAEALDDADPALLARLRARLASPPAEDAHG